LVLSFKKELLFPEKLTGKEVARAFGDPAPIAMIIVSPP
jgi:hypothetical protein